MKKFVCFLMGLGLLLALTACGGNNGPAPTCRDYVDLRFSVASADDCPNGEIDDEFLRDGAYISGGQTFYLTIDCNITSFVWTSEEKLDIDFGLSSVSDYDITLEKAETGSYTELMEDGELHNVLSYTIPEDRKAACSYRVIFRVRAYGWGQPLRVHAIVSQTERAEYGYVTGGDENYILDRDGKSYTLMGLNTSCTHAVIAREFAGIPVAGIAAEAFRDRTELESVEMGAAIERVGEDAFAGCTGLSAVDISDIDAWCRIDFANIEANPLALAKHLSFYGNEVTSIGLSEDVSAIGPYVFYGYQRLTYADLGNADRIGDAAFFGCTGLKSVGARRNFGTVGEDAFSGCPVDTLIVHDTFSYVADLRERFPQAMRAIILSSSSGTVTVPADGFEYCLRGSPSFSLQAEEGEEVHLTLEDTDLVYSGPLDLAAADRAILTFSGTNRVRSTSYLCAIAAPALTLRGEEGASITFSGCSADVSGGEGGTAARLSALKVEGGNVSFLGGAGGYGDGGSYSSKGSKGGTGGTAIAARGEACTVEVSSGAVLTAQGGDGGTGGSGSSGSSGGESSRGSDGSDGGDGGTGGNGLDAQTLSISVYGEARFYGGNGGMGGTGGRGGNGGTGKTLVNILTGGKDGSRNYGGNGGNGGRGGNGGGRGYGIPSDSTVERSGSGSFENSSGRIGDGGKGGDGGNGGQGGNYYNAVGSVWQCAGGSGGRGGNGGDGGRGGMHGSGGSQGAKGSGKPVNGLGLGINFGKTFSDSENGASSGSDGADGKAIG